MVIFDISIFSVFSFIDRNWIASPQKTNTSFISKKLTLSGIKLLSPSKQRKLKELYLHCGKSGDVFTKTVQLSADGVPEDRQTWFRVLPDKGEEYIRQEAYENYIECETVTITETFQGTEDSANGIFLHEGGTSEDPDVGNSKYPVKGNSDAPRRGKSEDTREVTPEDVKEANSQESGTGVLEDPREESYQHGDEGTSV